VCDETFWALTLQDHKSGKILSGNNFIELRKRFLLMLFVVKIDTGAVILNFIAALNQPLSVSR
jgi:hypothetical protein